MKFLLVLSWIPLAIPQAWSPYQKVSVKVEVPKDIADPMEHTFYSRRKEPQNEPGRFHRGDVESHPIGLRSAQSIYNDYYDTSNGRIPLRDAVEHIPIEGEMAISLRSGHIDTEEDGPFNRGSVEAFPFPFNRATEYSAFNDPELNSYVMEFNEEDSGAGYRGDIENPTQNQQSYFRGASINRDVFDSIWRDGGSSDQSYLYTSKAGADASNYVRTAYSAGNMNSDQRKLVCLMQGWAANRESPYDFGKRDVDPFACTHLIYSHAEMDSVTNKIMPVNHEREVVRGAYKSIVSLKQENPNLKVMIALGGMDDNGSSYSRMLSVDRLREIFINSIVEFLTEHGFDGIDLGWRFPGSTDKGGRSVDKANFVRFADELGNRLQQHHWILSASIPLARTRLQDGYDLAQLSRSIDFFNVQAFDLRGPWDGAADHHAPLESRPSDSYFSQGLNIKDGITYIVNEGVPKKKIILGLPFYGRSFLLQNPSENTPGSKTRSMGPAHRFTSSEGLVAYFEICITLRNGGWEQKRDPYGVPYMHNEDHWIGYDDSKYVAEKAEFAKKEDLGGVMAWGIDMDDYLAMCGKKSPLLSSIRRALYSPKSPDQVATIRSPYFNANYPVKSRQGRSFKKLSTNPPEIVGKYRSIGAYNCTEPGYFQDTSQCDVYYLCTKSLKSAKLTCPKDKQFDITTRSCRHLETPCKHGNASLDWTPADTCAENGLFSHPHTCREYIWCSEGEASILECHGGTYFDIVSGKCTEKDSAFCVPGTMVAIPKLEDNKISQRKGRQRISASNDYKVVCYYTNWAAKRPGEGKFVPENIDANLCTHIIYAFSVLDKEKYELRSSDVYIDIESDFYGRTLKLKEQNPNLKVLLSIGGWTDSNGDKYSVLVNDPKLRANFVRYAVEVLNAYDFDGLDVHWEFPVCWKMDCRRGPPSDKPGFANLMSELRQAFDQQPSRLILSVAVSAARGIIQNAYDIPRLSQDADLINVMTYDFHGAWEKKTGHHSPLFHRPNFGGYESQSTDFAMRFWVQSGADIKKLIMGIPFYGQTFRLASVNNQGLTAPVVGYGKAGAFTQQVGFMSYAEICQAVRDPGWQKVRDSTGALGPYAYKDTFWVGYDDPAAVTTKANYIVKNGYGGAMIWTIDLDDFHNRCCRETMPLLRAINRVLRSVADNPPRPGGDCSRPNLPVTPPPPVRTTTYSGSQVKKLSTHYGDLLALTTTPKTTGRWRPSTRTTTAVTTSAASTSSSTSTWWWTPPPQTTTQSTTSSTTTSSSTSRPWWYSTTDTTTTTTEAYRPPPTGNTGSSSGISCTNRKRYQSDPSNCGKFFECQGGVYKQRVCVPGTVWNGKKQLCDWPYNVDCVSQEAGSPEKSPTTTSTTTTTTTERTTQASPQNFWNKQKPSTPINTKVSCKTGVRRKHNRACNKYFTCVNNKLLESSCPPGLEWSDKITTCTWPHYAKCSIGMRDTETSESGERVREGQPCRTPGTIKTFTRSCRAFLMCIHEAYLIVSCSEGQVFDPVSKKCVVSTLRNCPAKIPMDTQPSPPYNPMPPMHQVQLEVVPKPPPLSGDYKVVCSFTNWGQKRAGPASFTPGDIDSSLCTHVTYAFASLDPVNLVMEPMDRTVDIDRNFYADISSLQYRGVKVLLSLGGWIESGDDKYSRMASTKAYRQRFINHAIGFLKRYNFNGLQLDWQYPVCKQTKCDMNYAFDKQNFALLLKELSEAFRPQGLLLSATASSSEKIIDAAYDVQAMNMYLDFYTVLTFDFHGSWDKVTGHHAPIYKKPGQNIQTFSMDYAVNHWIQKGADREKIVVAMPTYGRSFTLNDASNNGLEAPAMQPGNPGPYTRGPGVLAYYEICEYIRNGWAVVQDPDQASGPYAYQGDQWVGFDDVNILRTKANYIRSHGLAGGMIWSLDLDDFKNMCNQGAYPLLSTVASVLGPAGRPASKPITQPAGTQETSMQPSGPIRATADDFKVVCYFTNWAFYRTGKGKYTPEDIDPTLCTHILYGFAVLDGNTLLLKPHDRWADLDNDFYGKVVGMKKKNPNVKVLLALGGWNDSRGPKYSKLINSKAARTKFIGKVVPFLEKYGFDGLDLDFEYPVCWQVDCTKGPPSDKPAFAAWVMELSAALKPKGLLLSAAVSPSNKVIDAGYDVPVLSKYLDFINVMTYDYHGQWDKQTGHVAPLYEHPKTTNKKFNANFTMNYWLEKGADRKKLIMGMPMYGQSFTLTQTKKKGLNQKSYGGGEAGKYTRARGFLSYYEICSYIQTGQWSVVRDPLGAIGPYATKGNQWVGFDDIPMIRKKSEYVLEHGFGGAMIWALDLDDFRDVCGCEPHPLLRTINRVLKGYNIADPQCELLEGGTAPLPSGNQVPTVPLAPSVTQPEVQPIEPPQPPVVQPSMPEVPPQTSLPSAPSTGTKVKTPSSGKYGNEGAPCKDGQFFRHMDCNKFYECYRDVQKLKNCAPGRFFDGKGFCRTQQSVCTYIRDTSYDTSVTQVKPKPWAPAKPWTPAKPWSPSVTIPQTPIVQEPSVGGLVRAGDACKGKAKTRRTPGKCDSYLRCVHNVYIEEYCSMGLQFNTKTQNCDWPNNVKCTTKTVGSAKPQPQPSQPDSQPSQPDVQPSQPVQPPSSKPDALWPTVISPPISPVVPSGPVTIPTLPALTPGTPPPDGYKVVCYFTNWAWYRPGVGKYKPSNIDPDLCTHILYGFAVLHPTEHTIKPHDTWADYDNKFYEQVVALKAKGIKILLALGGWNDSAGTKYSTLVNNPAKRTKFITHVIDFLTKHNFDGLDLDWEYPACPQVDCNKGPASDKTAFTAWVRELKAAFRPHGFLLTAAVSPSYKVIDAGYEVAELSREFDFINVMTYDYHGHWDKKTGHVAPMFHHPKSEVPEFNANYTIHYWLQKGADPHKLIMGIPMYGQAFTVRGKNRGLNSKASKGQAGRFTRAAGFLAYYEICTKVKNEGFIVVRDPEFRIGPYAYKGNQWVGFDDSAMIEYKSNYIKAMGLGGGMIWALDLDDFNNVCNCEPHPLLRTINRVLRNYPGTSNCVLG